MRHELLRTTALVLALAGGIGISMAQTSGPTSGNDHAGQPVSKSDQNAKQEPTAKPANEAASKPEVFVDGKLNVEGAPQNTDTVPAKFSDKKDADDKTIIVGYAFKELTDEQRQKIYDAVKGGHASAANVSTTYTTGAELPAEIELASFPPEVTAAIPQTGNYRYVMAGQKVLLVSPSNKIVVGEITR
jgi:hypothetical protein